MRKLDPTLLRTFVEVARQGSEKAAAKRLRLSDQDVARRIKAIELRLGHPLFERRGEALTLTPRGQVFFEHLDAGFTAAEKAKGSASGQRLIVSTLGSFAKGWLTPRLPGLAKKHPKLSLSIESDPRPVDFDRDRADLAVRLGFGDYPGLRSYRLYAPEMAVVASPDLLSRGPALNEPADCVAYHLLRLEGRPYWRLWFESLGLDRRGFVDLADKGPGFALERDLLAEAAEGRGLAMVEASAAEAELRAGRLALALEPDWPEAFAFYLVGKPETFKAKPAAAFRDWILKEARRVPDRWLWPKAS